MPQAAAYEANIPPNIPYIFFLRVLENNGWQRVEARNMYSRIVYLFYIDKVQLCVLDLPSLRVTKSNETNEIKFLVLEFSRHRPGNTGAASHWSPFVNQIKVISLGYTALQVQDLARGTDKGSPHLSPYQGTPAQP